MMTWVVAAIMVALIILLYSILWSISGRAGGYFDSDLGRRVAYQELRRGLFLEAGVPFALQIVATFGALLAIILAAGAAGGEYSWGTVRLMATASSGRLRLITARLLVVATLIAVGALLAAMVALGYSAIITTYSGGSDFSFIDRRFIIDQFVAYARTLLALAPFVTLAFAAAIIGRSTLAGVGTGIGVAFLEPLISSLMRLGGTRWQQVPNYLIAANEQVVLIQNKVPAALPRIGPSERDLAQRGAHSPEVAALILVAYTAAFITIAFVVYRRRDITSGTSA